MKDFDERSKKIFDSSFLYEEYNRYSINQLYKYLVDLNGYSFLKKVYRKLFGVNKLYNKKDLLNIQNILQCDAHRELLLEAIKEKLQRGE